MNMLNEYVGSIKINETALAGNGRLLTASGVREYSLTSKDNNIQAGKLMANSEKERSQTSVKRQYELILCSKDPSQQLSAALQKLTRMSLSSQQHFSFLLHRINWFEHPFTSYRSHFFKICRLFRATGKQAAKVIHNLIIEGFFGQKSYLQALECLAEILKEGKEQRGVMAALQQNYPHKLCPLEIHLSYLRNLLSLCRRFPAYRADLLEIIIENLVKFDTQIVLGDQEVHNPFPNDRRMVEMRRSAAGNDLALKLDQMMLEMIEYFEQLDTDACLLDQLLLVFQSKVLPIKTTKNVQLLIFVVAEKSRARANTFISFLLANILQKQQHNILQKPQQQQGFFRVFSQSNFYLLSYLRRSRVLSQKAVCKTLLLLMDGLMGRLREIEWESVNSQTHLKHFLQSFELPLLILQSIIMVRLSHPSEHLSVVDEPFNEVITQASLKLQFNYFLNESILLKLGRPFHRTSHLRLKYSNKFLPSTLPKVGPMVDSLMLMEAGSEESEVIRKLPKNDTPISYCSSTVI